MNEDKAASAVALSQRQRSCVLVLGMHRSGTSALARVLNFLGLPLGYPLMPSHPQDNVSGFWELAEAVAIDRQILNLIGAPWDSPDALTSNWLHKIPRHLFDDASNLITANFSCAPAFVLKDPRICRLWPFWLHVFSEAGIRTTAVHLLRQPAEVAASLTVRDRFSLQRCAALWICYTVDAESIPVERALVKYDALLSDPFRTIDLLATWLSRLGIDLEPADRDAIGGFLQPALRHHRALPVLKGEIGALAEELYRDLTQGLDDRLATHRVIGPDRREEINDVLTQWLASRRCYRSAQLPSYVDLAIDDSAGTHNASGESCDRLAVGSAPLGKRDGAAGAVDTVGEETDLREATHTKRDELLEVNEQSMAAGDPQSQSAVSSQPLPPTCDTSFRVADRIQAVRLWLGLETRSIELVPEHEVRPLGAGSYEATGIDPQFTVDIVGQTPPQPWPSGWYSVTLRDCSSFDILSPKLFVDYGNGFSEESAITLPSGTAAGTNAFIHFESRALGLRFDPMDRAGRFRLGAMMFRRIPTVLVAVQILYWILWRTVTQDLSFKDVRNLWKLWRRAGFATVVAAVERDLDFRGRDFGWKTIRSRP